MKEPVRLSDFFPRIEKIKFLEKKGFNIDKINVLKDGYDINNSHERKELEVATKSDEELHKLCSLLDKKPEQYFYPYLVDRVFDECFKSDLLKI